jgi:hypothetical protein
MNLLSKLEIIFDIDESPYSATNQTRKVVAKKGAKCIYRITPRDRENNVRMMACCNAEEEFLPPIPVNKKQEF